MDKDLIRIIIFAIGLLVIVGMIVWSYLKHEKSKHNKVGQEPCDAFDHDAQPQGYPQPNQVDWIRLAQPRQEQRALG